MACWRYSERPMNKKLFQQLCETPGVPGREERVREVVRGSIRGLFDDVREDAMGSLICTRKSRIRSFSQSTTMVS